MVIIVILNNHANMKCNDKTLVIIIILSSCIISIIFSCDEKEEAEPSVVITEKVTGISTISAISGGNIISDGGSPVTARGICWDTTGSPNVYFTTDCN